MKKLFVIIAFVAAMLVAEKAQAQLNLHVDYSPELIKTYTPTADTTLFFHGFSFGLSWEFILNDNLSLNAKVLVQNTVLSRFQTVIQKHHRHKATECIDTDSDSCIVSLAASAEQTTL
jgi:hypothetical protein